MRCLYKKTAIVTAIAAFVLGFYACSDDDQGENGDVTCDNCDPQNDITCDNCGPQTETGFCGNNRIDTGEVCDGVLFDGKTCVDFLGDGATGLLKCQNCQIDSSDCKPKQSEPSGRVYTPNPGPQTVCNDRKHEAGEICDPYYIYTLNYQEETRHCVVKDGKCVLESIAGKGDLYNCGNGVLEPDEGEACDDGNVVDADGCDKKCQPEPDSVCKMKNGARALVALVVDGDTLNIRLDNGDCAMAATGAVRIRLHGIDTPECTKQSENSPTISGYKAQSCVQDDVWSEKNEKGGFEAAQFVKSLVFSEENKGYVDIECETRSDTDATCLTDSTNMRYLAYLRVLKDGVPVDLADEIVKAGYAMTYTSFSSQRLQTYCASENAAKDNRLGIWNYADTPEAVVKTYYPDKQDWLLGNHCK